MNFNTNSYRRKEGTKKVDPSNFAHVGINSKKVLMRLNGAENGFHVVVDNIGNKLRRSPVELCPP